MNQLLLACLLALAAPTLRADEEQDLVAMLHSTAGVLQKRAACQRLRIIGTAKSVPALAAELLGEERTAHAAVTIAEKLAGANPKLAAEVATKVLAQCKSPEIVKRAWALRQIKAAPGPFIQDWLVCGPYRQAGATGAEALFNIPFSPEKQGEAVAWKPVPRADMVNLMGLFPDQANCAAYLKTTIVAPENCEAALLLGSDDGVKAWLNGAVVHGNNIDRGAVADQDMAPITLRKGPNELMLKITQGGGGWAACARVVGADGLPIAGLKAQAEP